MKIDYDKFVLGLASDKYHESPILGGALGLAGEVLELVEDPTNISEQGDVLWYLTFAANSINTSLADLLKTNLVIVPLNKLDAFFKLQINIGNYVEHVKKHYFQEKPFSSLFASTQIFDIYTSFIVFLKACDTDLGTVMEHNINKLKDRYPEGKFDALLAPEVS